MTATVDFAISLCSSFGQSISAPTSSSSQAAEVFTSEIYVPTETSTPVETAILLYNEAPSPTAPVEEDVGKYATSDLPFPDSASFTVSTYLTSPVSPFLPSPSEIPISIHHAPLPKHSYLSTKIPKRQPLTSFFFYDQDTSNRRHHIIYLQQQQHEKQQHRNRRQKARPVPRQRLLKFPQGRLDCALRGISRRGGVGVLVVMWDGWMGEEKREGEGRLEELLMVYNHGGMG